MELKSPTVSGGCNLSSELEREEDTLLQVNLQKHTPGLGKSTVNTNTLRDAVYTYSIHTNMYAQY